MRNFCLRKNQKFKKLKKEENKINNRIDTSINSLNRININKFCTYKSNNSPNNSFCISINKCCDKNDNRKNLTILQPSQLKNILGKINKEFHKNKKIYSTNLSKCIQKDYLISINNSKINNSTSNNITRNYSMKSINKKSYKLSYNYERKNNIYFYENNKAFTYQSLIKENSPFAQNYNNTPIYKICQQYSQKNIKNKISNFILKNPYNPQNINIVLEKDLEDNKNNNIFSLNKSHKKNGKKSQNKFKKRISPVYNDLSNEKNKDNMSLSNTKNMNNLGNFYSFWTDNDGHMGGKINLALNNSYRNTIDFYSSLFYIIKIQSAWRGYNIRKILLSKTFKNQKLNIK